MFASQSVEVLLELTRCLKIWLCQRAVDPGHPMTGGQQLKPVGDPLWQESPPVNYGQRAISPSGRVFLSIMTPRSDVRWVD